MRVTHTTSDESARLTDCTSDPPPLRTRLPWRFPTRLELKLPAPPCTPTHVELSVSDTELRLAYRVHNAGASRFVVAAAHSRLLTPAPLAHSAMQLLQLHCTSVGWQRRVIDRTRYSHGGRSRNRGRHDLLISMSVLLNRGAAKGTRSGMVGSQPHLRDARLGRRSENLVRE